MSSPATTVRAAATTTATKTAAPASVATAGSVSRPPEPDTTELATAPRTAAPTALPIDRANMLAPVATPRSSHETLACAAMSDGVATSPMPRPVTKHVAATTATEGCWARAARTRRAEDDEGHADEDGRPEAQPQVEQRAPTAWRRSASRG